ncbi:MAG TPA: aromatic ring-hydroxylating dioxygenase subunit alpha [Candidatus Binataceae bacterium]|nr:aromatic ring-hydroxylating dioxygenase subunit alpha [Candidatus Binataceae bacterium]
MAASADVLDGALPPILRKSPEPALDASLIPKERYLSPEVMRLEWDRMWRRVWLYAGPLSDLGEVGDYFTFEIGPESVLVVRTGADQLQAMYNVCQHRGRRIRQEGCGTVRSFTCPYHRWRYDLGGRLIEAPDSDFDFPQGDPVAARMRIPQVRCEVFEGLVFVNFDADAQPLSEYLTGDVVDHLQTYRWGSEFRINLDWTVAWPCNWKIGVDSFNELYHLQGIHPELMDMSDDTPGGCPLDFYGRHSRFIYRVGVPGPRWDDEMARGRGYRDSNQITAGVRMILKAYGLDAPEWEGHVKELRPALIAAARERAGRQGVDVSGLVDDQLLDDFHYFLFPNITLNISAHHFWLFRHRPHPRDPQQMLWDFQQFVRVRPGQSAPPRPAHENYVIGDGHEGRFPHIALAQDEAQAEELQRGMRSAGFKGLYLAHQERRIRYFHRVLDDYLALSPGA